mmetsp:Transcript_30914/g.100644  ORF Transcript_30914/g.100644 Transcript_30914/m.100644 type:complete len:632 (+) Transcript_30914:219-2114(+)
MSESKGALRPGPLSRWPWESLGQAKYVVLLPLVWIAAYGEDVDGLAKHLLIISALRLLLGQIFITLGRVHAVADKTRIQSRLVNFAQVDRENDWDDFILLQALVVEAVHLCPGLGYEGFPLWDGAGLWKTFLLHIGPTEFVYYWLHRLLHNHDLYAAYHSHHHASFVCEPISGTVHPFMEHLMYTANFAIPLVGTWLAAASGQGGASIGMFYVYLLGFDVMNAIGHCNFEFFPLFLFKALPWLKYLVYTPTFHSLHHSKVHCNFALFMPLYDYVYGTADPGSDTLYEAAIVGEAAPYKTPAAVFLAHGTELLSFFHLSFMFKGFASRPYETKWWVRPFWPLAVLGACLVRIFGQVFCYDKHMLGKMPIETWVTPAFAIQYFFKREHKFINAHIASAIRKADAAGVKVIGLGALNKAEAVNGGGAIFTKEMPDLRVRVVHGNTLTAAAILRKLPVGTKEVFLTGATSKLGRALALYLSARGVLVRMYTSSLERYEQIAKEASSPEQRALLVRAERLEDGAQCDTWVVGKYLREKEQRHAPAGTTFHQFVVPPIPEERKDCQYTDLPAFRLPKSARGFRTCEMTMQRNCVHACHAGALVHALEGWTHHEVGKIDHDFIDTTWDAAMAHGFQLV